MRAAVPSFGATCRIFAGKKGSAYLIPERLQKVVVRQLLDGFQVVKGQREVDVRCRSTAGIKLLGKDSVGCLQISRKTSELFMQ